MAKTYSALIIDDSGEVRIILTRYFKNLGFETIDTAEDGRAGLDKARSTKPDIVILDGIMPELDGIKALPEIKKESPNTVVVICSSLSDKSKVMAFKNAGADFYILKPFDRERFEEVINQAIEILASRPGSAS
ncbi:MAG: response regulator [Ignavibacteriales bacterium]|nr:response regulator [Ignavibacteriales bacterium]